MRFLSTWAIAGLAAFSLLGLPSRADAHEHRMIVGIATTVACITQWWHGDPTGTSSLDLATYSNNGCGSAQQNTTAGKSVYWQSYHYSGWAMLVEVIPYSGSCNGAVRLRPRDSSNGAALGDYWYTHVAPGVSVGTMWYAEHNFWWTFRYVGTVLASDTGCPWTGPHVHQGGDNSSWTAVYRNLSTLSNPINPTGSHSSNWVHKYWW
jgi:hypothetical protein